MNEKIVKLKSSVKKKWLKALRSGEYTQGQGELRDSNNNFCCLGVLCNLHAQAHPKLAAKQKDPTLYFKEGEVLPAKVIEWAFKNGGKDVDPHVYFRPSGSGDTYLGRDELTALNDHARCSFKQIANVIDKYL